MSIIRPKVVLALCALALLGFAGSSEAGENHRVLRGTVAEHPSGGTATYHMNDSPVVPQVSLTLYSC